jgi:RHS repeat-associated protein
MNGLSYRKDEKIINQYQYNGKEKREELGLNWNDYGARFYDPQLGRWHTPDPLASKFSDESPYAYAGNNPVANIDPDGQSYRQGSQKYNQEQLRRGGDAYFYRLALSVGDPAAVQRYRFEQIGRQAAADFRKNDLWSKYHRYYDDARSPGPFESMAATLGGLLVPAIPSLAMAIHGARSGNYGEFAVGLLGFGLDVAALASPIRVVAQESGGAFMPERPFIPRSAGRVNPLNTDIPPFGKYNGEIHKALENSGWIHRPNPITPTHDQFILTLPHLPNGFPPFYALDWNPAGSLHGKNVAYWKLTKNGFTTNHVIYRSTNNINFTKFKYPDGTRNIKGDVYIQGVKQTFTNE